MSTTADEESTPTNADVSDTVQQFIVARLSEKGQSQTWFAKRTNLSLQQLNIWLRGRKCSAKWIRDRAAKFAEVLGCPEAEILSRIEASMRVQICPGDPQPLNKEMLRALYEDESPTNEILDMLQRVQDEVGCELNYAVCKELIQLSKTHSP